MSAVFNVDHTIFVNFRAAVIILVCHHGKRNKSIKLCYRFCCFLDADHFRCDPVAHFTKQIVFQIDQLVLCS